MDNLVELCNLLERFIERREEISFYASRPAGQTLTYTLRHSLRESRGTDP
jgi:hypothetical protein